MLSNLTKWETRFEKRLAELDPDKCGRAGALLPFVPDREEWDDFLGVVRDSWWTWKPNIGLCPKCLVVLYGGLAFFEYEDRKLWPKFAQVVGAETIPVNQQTDINAAFAGSATELGLKILQRPHGTLYVGSAVFHVGIPLSLWDGFLEFCEWALWNDQWKDLDNQDWETEVTSRAGGRTRLRSFLIDNREAAGDCIREMLDAQGVDDRLPRIRGHGGHQSILVLHHPDADPGIWRYGGGHSSERRSGRG
jgi:hypothetical protein